MTKSRLDFVDLMRGIAMLVMIEVHVVNSLMDMTLRNTSWFGFINFANGLVAPSFIFISGFAFVLASQKKLPEYRKFRYAFWKQLGRIGLIWFTGYMLHIPYFSLQKCIHIATERHWLKFQSIDVLQCIAFGLFIIFILRLVIKNDRIFIVSVSALGISSVAFAPYAYNADLSHLPVFVATYIAPVHYTLFPIFPWFGFMAAGIWCAWVFTRYNSAGKSYIFFKRLLMVGILMALISLPLMFYIKDYLGLFNDVRPNALFFIARLGFVTALLSLCFYYCQWRGEPSAIILYPSRESLAVYFIHLQILHRELWKGKSLVDIYPNTLSFWICIVITIAMILAILPMARIWNYWKSKYEYFGLIAVWTMIFIGGIIFLLR
ncbi:MAG TPA: heparan-alpha-glucosaminide N-acetyltransferase domain-containing protein [Spirochaetota bacterium]|nr:heparan-alpha-glucosaminide N-acetyltransferase domain-containing protein [Spirochaetota bacterium]